MKILRMLARESGLVEPSWIFAQSGGNNGDLKMLAEAGLIEMRQDQVWRDPLEDASFVTAEPPTLTRDQDRVWSQIQSGITASQQGKAPAPFLLHGVTGSGKTNSTCAP